MFFELTHKNEGDWHDPRAGLHFPDQLERTFIQLQQLGRQYKGYGIRN